MTIIRQNGSVNLLPAATVAAGAVTGAWVKCYGPNQTFQATEVGSAGAYTGTVVIEASNDGVNAVATPVGTITLAGTGTTLYSDGFVSFNTPWAWMRAKLTAITGTTAVVNVWMGC